MRRECLGCGGMYEWEGDGTLISGRLPNQHSRCMFHRVGRKSAIHATRRLADAAPSSDQENGIKMEVYVARFGRTGVCRSTHSLPIAQVVLSLPPQRQRHKRAQPINKDDGDDVSGKGPEVAIVVAIVFQDRLAGDRHAIGPRWIHAIAWAGAMVVSVVEFCTEWRSSSQLRDSFETCLASRAFRDSPFHIMAWNVHA